MTKFLQLDSLRTDRFARLRKLVGNLTQCKESLLLGILLTSAMLVASYGIAYSQNYQIDGDFFELWLAGRMVIRSEGSIWNETQWLAEHIKYGNQVDRNPVFPYPPLLAYFFAPLGLLSLKGASILWAFLSQVMILVSYGLLAVSSKSIAGETKERSGASIRSAAYALPVLAAFFLFRPVLVTLRNGQLSAFFLFILSLALYEWRNEHWFAGGLILGVSALRPNIGIPIISILGIWLLLRKQGSALFGIGVSFLGALAIGWVQEPNWFQAWMKVSDGKLIKTFGYHANLWGISGHLCGRELACTIGLGGLIGLGLFVSCLLLLFYTEQWKDSSLFMAMACTIALLLTPYMWAYDLAFLVIPVVIAVELFLELGFPYLVVSLYPLTISFIALMLLALAMDVGDDGWSGITSLVSLLVLMMLVGLKKRWLQSEKIKF